MTGRTEIIVYRNPLEAAIWDSLQGGNGFIIGCAAVVFIASFWLFSFLFNRFVNWKFHHSVWGYAPIVGAGIVTVLVARHMLNAIA